MGESGEGGGAVVKRLKKYRWYFLALILLLGICYWFSLPEKLFETPTCTVINDREGDLLGAKIADDGQWRFPHNDSVPEKFSVCLVEFEDKHFYTHPGINPFSMLRAAWQNITTMHRVSGGSTLTMQVIRISRPAGSRNIFRKVIEMILATRIELAYSKEEILSFYASNAPFGGNVVGLDAASWRYFGRNATELSWAEAATLAVLPNAPSLIYPGKNHDKLLQKRNRLLKRLHEKNTIDKTSYELSCEEPLPEKPLDIPQRAPHLLTRFFKQSKGKKSTTTIDGNLQQRVAEKVNNHYLQLKHNEIHNAAVLVVEVKTGNVLAYIGNTDCDAEHNNQVDVVSAARSTGSVMKPLLFASMLNDGELLPGTLIADIPTQIAGYSPKNFSLTYEGAVPAKQALAKSLNIPAIRMLREHGVEKFHYQLQKLGMTTLTKDARHYGLSIILGGAEATLWELTGIYASLSRTLNHYPVFHGDEFRQISLSPTPSPKPEGSEVSPISAGAIYQTYEAMAEVNRPDIEAGWKTFSSSGFIAWKTGTSFGFRDGWAIGTTPEYVVGVWVGNADGEGRPGLTGIGAAAPLMFDVFSLLSPGQNFLPPYDNMEKVAVCHQSGHRAGSYCEEIDSVRIPFAGLKTEACPYHRLVHLDKTKRERVNSSCYATNEMIHANWFVLPPAMEWYYKSKNPSYKTLPPMRANCTDENPVKNMELIYPHENIIVYVPVKLDGTRSEVVFEAAHRRSSATIFWHLDNTFIAQTKNIHQIGLNPEEGKHLLTLVDENGETIYKSFEVVKK